MWLNNICKCGLKCSHAPVGWAPCDKKLLKWDCLLRSLITYRAHLKIGSPVWDTRLCTDGHTMTCEASMLPVRTVSEARSRYILFAGQITAWEALHIPFGNLAKHRKQILTNELAVHSKTAFEISHWSNLAEDAITWIASHREVLQESPCLSYRDYACPFSNDLDRPSWTLGANLRFSIFKLVNEIAARLKIPGMITASSGGNSDLWFFWQLTMLLSCSLANLPSPSIQCLPRQDPYVLCLNRSQWLAFTNQSLCVVHTNLLSASNYSKYGLACLQHAWPIALMWL